MTGPLPAVLCPHGHWRNGRFLWSTDEEIKRELESGAEKFASNARSVLQSRCASLARLGCLVFHYDMIGYADSQQLSYDLAHGFKDRRAELEDPARWGLFSPAAELRLQSVMGLQTWNSIRALDFLETLPEVDRARIGVTVRVAVARRRSFSARWMTAPPSPFRPSWSRLRCKAAVPARIAANSGSIRGMSSSQRCLLPSRWA